MKMDRTAKAHGTSVDRLAIINDDPADATLADLSITFLGKRT